jgi:uncharacterized protein YndB with AHSA1/START domain
VSVRELESGPELLIVQADYPAVSPETLFRYWVEPERMTRWWPREAKIDPRVGGEYVFRWPTISRELRGRYTALEPAERLAFTWRWDTTPADYPDLQVSMRFEPLDGVGTRLVLEHGPYDDSPDGAEARKNLRDAWFQFLARLQTVAAGDAA